MPLEHAAARRLVEIRERAKHEAEAALKELGFFPVPEGRWAADLEWRKVGRQRITVKLPPAFPDEAPEVFVDRAALPVRAPHVELTGRICVIPRSGVLLDASRPRELVGEALERAERTLADATAQNSELEFRAEFVSYWGGKPTVAAYSICRPSGKAREIVRLRVSKGLPESAELFAETSVHAGAWLKKLGGTSESEGKAFFLSLSTPFLPPDFDERVSVRHLIRLVEEHAAEEDAKQFRGWLSGGGLPAWVLLSIPGVGDAGRILVAARVEEPRGDAKKKVQAGFRPGTVPPRRMINFTLNEPVTRVHLERLDAQFLTARGGAGERLAESVVTVVGLGAVGSWVATELASLGVGELHFVDHDLFGAENVHRHVLGIRHLNRRKASTMALELGSRFPHLTFEARDKRFDEVLMEEPAFITDVNLVIVALGDETLELRLNDLLRDGPPRLHSWIEPLGLAGHVLACGLPGSRGCFACLFHQDSAFGLINRAALTAPGQEISRSLAGCAGTFSPFSVLDATRNAVETAALAGRILAGRQKENALVTWRGDDEEFLAGGYRLSPRELVVPPQSRVVVSSASFAQPNCPVCSDHQMGTLDERHSDV